MKNVSNKLNYLSHIDSLRAVAILLVVLFHLEIGLFKGGFIGVDIFFVISGFLITRILTHEFSETGSIDFRKFYMGRARRLLPALFLTILLTFIVAFLVFSPSDFMNATNSMFMSSVALSNLYFLGKTSYFDISSNFKPLLHTWSLGIEEQFYLLYPITLFFLLKVFSKKRYFVTISLGALFVLSVFYTYYTSGHGVSEKIYTFFIPGDGTFPEPSSLHFYLLPFRMFEFLTGSIISLLVAPKIKSECLRLLLNLSGFILIGVSALFFSKYTHHLSLLNLLPCFGVGLLLYFPPTKFLSFFYDNKFLSYTGKISYTLYLIHWLVIVTYRYLFDDVFSITVQVGLVIIMFVLSSAIYKYYETPLRYKTAKFSIKSNQSFVLIVIICVLAVNSINLKVNSESGWLWRMSDENLALIEKIGAPKDYHKNNWGGAGYSAGWVGSQPKDGVEPDMIWLGDSHAGHYLYGLDNIMVKQDNLNVYIANWFSALKLPDIIRNDRDGYDKLSKDRFEKDLELIRKYNQSVVVLSHSWVSQISIAEIFNSNENKYEKFPKGSAAYTLIAQKIELLHSLIGADRKIVIIGSSPTTGDSKLNYVEKLMRPKYIKTISPTVSTFEQNNIEFNSFLKEYFSTSTNIYFLDPAGAFCSDGICIKQSNGEIYFSDGGHISKDGSLKAIKYMEQKLLSIMESGDQEIAN